MKKVNILFVVFSLFIVNTVLLASPIDTAKDLGLIAGSKAIVQWERVFKSQKKMQRYKIDSLTKVQQDKLKEYLINHAADSDQPTVAGM